MSNAIGVEPLMHGTSSVEAGRVERPRSVEASRIRLGLIAVATALGLFECAKGMLQSKLSGRGIPFADHLLQNLPWWYSWVAVSPIIIWAARRFRIVGEPMTRGRLAGRIGIHFLIATIVTSVQIVAVGALFFYSFWVRIRTDDPVMFIRSWFEGMFVSNLLTYALIAGGYYVYDYSRRLAESARQTERLGRAAAELERGLADARLEALRSELNPHFLFNALNGVAGLVRLGDANGAITMLSRIADLLRATLDRGSGVETTLADEMSLLERYLDIERVRFGNRLSVSITVPIELADALVPSFALQPLVENAIRHGIAKQPGEGAIAIAARADDTHLVVTVRDTGCGVSETSSGGRSSGGTGVGLANTRARIDQLYGDRAALTLRNWERGCEAELRVPLHVEEVTV